MSAFAEESETQKRIDAAIAASSLKVFMLVTTFAYLLTWIPKVGHVLFWLFAGCMLALLVATAMWWIRFRAVSPDDTHFTTGRVYPAAALVVWTALAIVWILGSLGITPTAPFLLPSVESSQQRSDAALQLQKVLADEFRNHFRTVVVVRDTYGVYHAFQIAAMEKVTDNVVTLEKRRLVLTVVPKRPGTRDEIEDCFVRKYNWRGWSSFDCAFGQAEANGLTEATPITVQEFIMAEEMR